MGTSAKIWANSGDSHVMEPADLWSRPSSGMPGHLVDRTPHTERDRRHESIYVDGQVVFRTLNDFAGDSRAPGSYDHTRETLHSLFDGVPDIADRMTRANFDDLFGTTTVLPATETV